MHEQHPTGLPALDPSLPVPVAMLVAALDAMSTEAAADIPPAQALLVTQVLLVQADRLRALTLARVADVDRRQLHDLDECPSTGTWVAEQQTSMPRSDVALARRLDRTPLLAARIAAGGLSVSSGVRVSRVLAQLRPHVDRPDGRIDGQPSGEVLPAVILDGTSQLVAQSLGGLADDDPRLLAVRAELAEIIERPVSEAARLEAAFLVLARFVPAALLTGALQRLADALLPNELAERAEESERRGQLTLVRDDERSGWEISGWLDLECGEMAHTVLTAAMATDPDNVLDTATAEQLRAEGLDPYEDGCLRVRSRKRRQHDGLKLALRRLLDSGALGLRGKHVPHVAVTISAPALHDRPGALPARAASGASWPASLVRAVLCDSAITRFVLSLGSRVIEMSHTERTLKPHERRIKLLETGGVCQAAGCSKGLHSGHPLVPHHVTAYARCRETSLAQTVLLCDGSHHDLHVGSRTIRLKDGRRLSAAGWVDGAAA